MRNNIKTIDPISNGIAIYYILVFTKLLVMPSESNKSCTFFIYLTTAQVKLNYYIAILQLQINILHRMHAVNLAAFSSEKATPHAYCCMQKYLFAAVFLCSTAILSEYL